jgi:hypothetical protein
MTSRARQTTLFDMPPAARPADDMDRGAVFSDDGLCRFELHCRWAQGPLVSLLLTNPSLADGDRNDMTSIMVHDICRYWGKPGYIIGNVSPYISSDMARMWAWLEQPESRMAIRQNLKHLRLMGEQAEMHVVAFGNDILHQDPDLVVEALDAWLPNGKPLYCLGVTASGAPIHPAARGHHRLVPHAVKPIAWREDVLVDIARDHARKAAS